MKFQIGQTVWNEIWGAGIIKRHDEKYKKYTVLFGINSKIFFCNCSGRELSTDVPPTRPPYTAAKTTGD